MQPAIAKITHSRLHHPGAVLFLCCAIFFTSTSNAQEHSLAQELLARMSEAVRQLNYHGTFTFEVADSAIETYELTHWVDKDGEKERLLRLNGREKTVVRSNAETDCLAIGEKILRGHLGKVHPSDQLFSNYSLYLRGEQRIANRLTYLLQLVPHDVFRNGQTIAVDKETFLPLQKQWFNPDNQLIERLQFVNLEIVSDARLLASKQRSSAPVLKFDQSPCATDSDPQPGRSNWVVNWLPKGFFLTRVGSTDEGETMLTYTDGLASFSVFVLQRPVSIMIQGKSDRGATVAFVGNRMWQQQTYRVTVIGEVPLITAQKVVASVAPAN